jgi:hypothetical protein
VSQLPPESAPSGTPPSGDTPPQHAGAPSSPIKLSEIVDEWMKYGNDVIDRVQARAKTNAPAVENRTYGRDDLFSDLAWFWDQAAKDAAAAAKYLRDKYGAT